MKTNLTKLDQFLFNEVAALSIVAAVAHLKTIYITDGKEKDKEKEKEKEKAKLRWRDKVKAELLGQLDLKTNKPHAVRIEKFIESIEDVDVLLGGKLCFGVGQKILNLFLKYAWAIGWVSEEPLDCPVDSRILKKLGFPDNKKWRWSTLPIEKYECVMKRIDEVCKPLNLSRAEWELITFEKLRPTP